MLILGISNFEHDAAAALTGAQGLLAAIEEDKLTRAPGQAGLPLLAVEGCLALAQSQLKDMDLVAVASRPRHAWLRAEHLRSIGSLPVNHAAQSISAIAAKLEALRQFQRTLAPRTPLLHFEHHLCHAASAYYASGFDRALVLTLDEAGDMWSGWIGLGEGEALKRLRVLRYANSLGLFYSSVTALLGFRPRVHDHKTQWLGVRGAPDVAPAFRKLIGRAEDGVPFLKRRHLRATHGGRVAFAPGLLAELGARDGVIEPAARPTIACSAQAVLEETVTALAETWRKKTGATCLCVAGGVFLNVCLVRALEKQTGFEKVFVQPVAGNPGTALGAAYLGRRKLTGSSARAPLTHLNLGPKFEASQVKYLLDNSKIIYRFLEPEERLIDEVVRLLLAQKIVAWYQGRTEFGLRALGNRTIVASPFSPYVRENLNHYLKHREDFHPFALSVTKEGAGKLFHYTENSRFLATVGALRAGMPDLASFAFRGNEVRVHVVEQETNPRFWRLLTRFGEQAPAPVLVNTSFNLFGEPLVSGPREALRSFFGSGIDALALGQFLVIKP